MLRLFVACVPSAATRALLAAEAARLRRAAPALRVVAEADLHLTLAFLGETAVERVGPLRASLAPVAAAQRPVEVRVEGLGAFPTFHRPRVVWAGVEAGAGASVLRNLARRVRRACLEAGCPPDASGRYEPHVTLGRLRGGPPPAALEMCLTEGALQGTYTPEVLSDLVLMVSDGASVSDIEPVLHDTAAPEATPPGGRYRVLARFPFGGCGDPTPRRSAGGDPGMPPGGHSPGGHSPERDGTRETGGGTCAR